MAFKVVMDKMEQEILQQILSKLATMEANQKATNDRLTAMEANQRVYDYHRSGGNPNGICGKIRQRKADGGHSGGV